MICEFSNWWLCGVGSWKRAGNSAFEFSSTKRKLCRRRRPTTWTTKASEMRQPDWISIRWVSRVCANVCALGNERLPHGLDVRLSFQFPLSLIEQRLCGWRKGGRGHRDEPWRIFLPFFFLSYFSSGHPPRARSFFLSIGRCVWWRNV